LAVNVKYASAQDDQWQQRLAYKIDVTLDDQDHRLDGQISIEYTNNSPDTLREIYLHLWPNAFKDQSSDFAKQKLAHRSTKFYRSLKSERGYIAGFDFMVDSTKVKTSYQQNNEIVQLSLKRSLRPGESAIIQTPFSVKVPKSFSRLGHVDQSYQITQWYPKPAVYAPSENQWQQSEDKKNQWYTMPYLDQGEFYSEFGLELKGRDEPITTLSFFTNEEATLWSSAPEYLEEATTFYSEKVGVYPYNQVSAVQSALSAGAGMEYPTITVIGRSGTARSLERVLVHEVGHNWFYGILASNERDYPWMDEGINSYYEGRFFREKYETNSVNDYYGVDSKMIDRLRLNDYSLEELTQWLNVYMGRKNYDQPICSHSTHLTDINYGLMVYMKAAMSFHYLEKYLGQKNFDRVMRSYYDAYAFKHPQPRHIRSHIENETGRNLEWFFDELLSTTKDSDYRLMGADLKANTVGQTDYDFIEVMNFHSQIKGPFSISAFSNDKKVRTIWYEGFSGRMDVSFPSGEYDYYELDALNVIPDINRSNNRVNAQNGRRLKPKFKTKLLGALEKEDRRYLFWAPFLGYNAYDKLMPGLSFYNNFLPGKNFEFIVTPMYSTNAQTLVGLGDFNYRIYPDNSWFQEVKIGLEAQRFHHGIVVDKNTEIDQIIREKPYAYDKLVPNLVFKLRNQSVHSTLTKTIELRHNRINKGPFESSVEPNIVRFVGGNSQKEDYYVNELNLKLKNDRVINPFNWTIELEQHPQFGKLTSELNFKFNYRRAKKGLNIRAFAGGFLWNDLRGLTPNSDDRLYEFKPSGNNGDQDYLFEQFFRRHQWGSRYQRRVHVCAQFRFRPAQENSAQHLLESSEKRSQSYGAYLRLSR